MVILFNGNRAGPGGGRGQGSRRDGPRGQGTLDMRRSQYRCVVLLAGLCAAPLGCAGGDGAPTKPAAAAKVQIEDLKVGTGEAAKVGDRVVVNYTGWLTDGTKFDSSLDHGRPFEFRLGAGNVIRGWDQGVEGMRVGGKRKLTIPPELGYGQRGMGKIPPDSTLIFEVELLEIK
jgi:hypothetical protein